MNFISLYKSRKTFCLLGLAVLGSWENAGADCRTLKAEGRKSQCQYQWQCQYQCQSPVYELADGDGQAQFYDIVENSSASKEHSSLTLGMTIQQQQQIKGTVRDANGAVAGVTVTVKGTAISTLTDDKGQYTISAKVGDELVFSYVGYASSTMTITKSNVNGVPLNIVLQEDTTTLKEVTINAGYYKVKEKERTGSIAQLGAKDLEQQPVVNVLAAMQGRLTGVNITQTTGTPGGGFEVQIRGQNSLRSSGNQPLYVIDGVPYAADPIGSGLVSGIFSTQPSPLNSINPNEIESIEVLKDADATAIYGSRGANGVVLITTKKGKKGATTFNTTVYQGVGHVTRFMDVLNTEQYLAMRREAFANDGIPIPFYAYDVNGTWSLTRNTNWQKELLGGTASISNANVSVSGGSGSTQYVMSGNYYTQSSVFPRSYPYTKGNGHLNVNHASEDKKFTMNVTAGYTSQLNRQPRIDLVQEAVTLAPNAPELYQADGSLNWENSTFNNPLRNLEGRYEARTNDFMASSLWRYQLTKQWAVQTSLGYTTLRHAETNAAPHTRYNPAFGLTSAFSSIMVGNTDRHSWIAEPQISYGTKWSNHEVEALAGATFQSQEGSMLVQYASGFTSNSLMYNLAAAANLFTLVNERNQYKYQAFYGRVNYQYNNQYIVNFTGRRDGSSRFGPGKQFAYFGAVGGAWLFSKNAALRNSSVLSFGKLRGSYGITGNDQIGDYQYLDTYGSTGVGYGGTIGLQPSRLYNPDFAWETNKKLELALELGFWKDRVFVTGSWYRNRSSNQLTGVPLPGTTGFTSVQANWEAEVQNQGVELTLRAVPFHGKRFNWTMQWNVSSSRNKLLSFPDLANSSFATQYVVGEPLSIKRVYQFTGVDPQTGVYTFTDVNGDGVLTSRDDKTTVVDLAPAYFGGVQNTLKYGNWQLDFLFQFVKQKNYSAAVLSAYPGAGYNQSTAVLDHWQQAGDVAPTQVFTNGSNGAAVNAYYNYLESDAVIVDASYVRLKNLSLSYTVPVKGVKCRLFFEGQNVLTFTKYVGLDPEFRSAGYLPPLRVLSMGTQLTF